MSWSDLEDLCSRAEVVGTDAGARPVRAFTEGLKPAVVRWLSGRRDLQDDGEGCRSGVLGIR